MASKLAKKKNPDLINEFDKRIERIRRTFNEAELLSVVKYLDKLGSGSGSSLEKKTPPPPPPKETPPPPSRNAYCYLYVQRPEGLSRLNVSKLSEGPIFELVCDFESFHHRDCLSPVVCFNVDSEIYMVGDVFVHEDEQWPRCYKPPFFDVLSIDTAHSPSFLPCSGTIAAGFTGPMVDPLVVTLHGKIYVMALRLYADQPCFQVFDNGKWETLPPPPFIPHGIIQDDDDLPPVSYQTHYQTHYAWGHKIVIHLWMGVYCFDTKKGEWIHMNHIYKERENAPVLQCVAQYNNFLIAKLFFREELVVYELDADGYPHFYQNLDELQEMFVDSRILSSSNAFIIPFDDDADKFCFICSGIAPSNTNMGRRELDFFLRVAVFRMSISNLDGNKKLTAVLEAHQVYPFYKPLSSSFDQHIYSAFLTRDNLDLDNLKADRIFGRACLD